MGFDVQSINVNYELNDQVRIINGPFSGFTGIVNEINKDKQKVKVLISTAGSGRETPVELDFMSVEKA